MMVSTSTANVKESIHGHYMCLLFYNCVCFIQEVPNYLRGYHKCKLEEVVKLSSFLYTAQFDHDLSTLNNLE